MDLDPQALARAYRCMKTIREFEERVNKEFLTGDLPGFLHVYVGQEAVATAVCFDLGNEDYIGSTHRGHGHCIAKGCDVKGMMKEIFGKRDGLCAGKGGSMHIADLDKGMLGANGIVGGGPPLAVGAALSAKTRGTNNIAVSFLGDGSSNQGTSFEAMNMAVVLQLPCVFVIENNGYGECTGVDYAVGAKSIATRTEGFGIPVAKVDGADFFAVKAAMDEATERCRTGGGPSAIEADVERFYGHYVGDPQVYRAPGEVEKLRETRDCLTIFREKTADTLDAGQVEKIDAEIAKLIDESVAEARAADFPSADDLLTEVYISY